MALVSTFSFTTQEQVNGAFDTLHLELEEEAHGDEEDCPNTQLVEEEFHAQSSFQLPTLTAIDLPVTFPPFIDMLPQLYQSDFLKPPSL